MRPEIILIIIIAFFSLEYFWESLLTFLNFRRSRKMQQKMPGFLQNRLSKERYQRAGRYTRERGLFSFVSSSFSFFITVILITSGAFAFLNRCLVPLKMPEYLHALVYLLSVSVFFILINIPFEIYSQFVIEKKYGFNKMTASIFIIDKLKSLFISLLLVVPLLLAVFFLMDRAGDYWWLIAFAVVALFQTLISWAAPVLIAPLFYKFKPLEEGPLKEKINILADKLSFKRKGIFVIDGSRRSSHSNAGFMGFGKSKRIVLFDTLLEQMEDEEIVAVLAHEIGHEKKKHIIQRLIASLLSMVIMFFLLDFLYSYQPLFAAFGFSEITKQALFLVLFLCSGPFTFMFTPLLSIWSRIHEYQADRYAARACGESKSLINALFKLSSENLSNYTPHPLYSFFHYSHPGLSERVKALEDFTPSDKKMSL